MYQNLYGNKILDFNDDVSPFKNINNIFAGNGNQKLGTDLISRTAKYSKNYRLCLIPIVAGGERYLTELKYDHKEGQLVIDPENQPTEEQKFKRFFQRNINVLDL